MQIFFIVIVLKMEFLPIIIEEEIIKELSAYANRREEISVDLNEEKNCLRK